jgi:hypothetical protein
VAMAALTSDDGRRWGWYLTTTAVAGVAALCGALATIKGSELLGRPKLPDQVLIDYQRQKLKFPVGQVIFLGDSSLGTSVNASLWQSLTGKTASSFALTASYGYAGTLDMLRSILAHHSPTDIVIIQTTAIIRKSPKEHVPSMSADETGYLQHVRDIWLETMTFNQFVDSADFLLRWARGKKTDTKTLGIESDYVRQIESTAKIPTPREFDPKLVNEANLLQLNEIAKVCRERSLTCVYLHGPLASPYCTQEKGYFSRVNALIRSSGLQLAQEYPPCLAPDEVGNMVEHTKLSFKDEMTGRIAAILKPYLTK